MLATLKIASAGSTLFGARAVAEKFAQANSVLVEVATDHGHVLQRRALSGELNADIVMIPADMIDALISAGRADQNGRADIGTVSTRAAIKFGNDLPDVFTRDTLSKALLAADEILLTLAPSGEHMIAVIEQLGTREQLAGKLRRFDKSTEVNAYLAQSDGSALAFGPATEIIAWQDRGIVWAGPIATEFQLALPYSAACLIGGENRDLSYKFLAYLASPTSRAAFVATGVD